MKRSLTVMEKSYYYSSFVENKFSFLSKEGNEYLKNPSFFDVYANSKNAEAIQDPNCYSIGHIEEHKEKAPVVLTSKDRIENVPISLNASAIGDFPVGYTIYSLREYEFPAVGVYIDPRIISGFKYRVRRLPSKLLDAQYKESYLFGGKPLTLLGIGRGYARRFTFENDTSLLNSENYFYSDNYMHGYAFELQVVFDTDKFTIYDANHESQGILEVVKVNSKQVEINSHRIEGQIQKRVEVTLTATVEFYGSVAQQLPISGIAICNKSKNQKFAQTLKIVDVYIKHHRYYLLPGYQENHRRICIRGGDIPTKYIITGVFPYEMPVVGTYIDPRILPGFYYKVRVNNPKKYLFNGKARGLQHIGLGYAKKLTFESDSYLYPSNYFWSDSYQDGYAFEIQVVIEGMKFMIVAQGQVLGNAEVFRADLPQIEEKMEKVQTTNDRCNYVKYVHVDVMCSLKVGISDSGGCCNENIVRVCGLAVTRKEPTIKKAYLEKIQNIAVDSQLNVLFARKYMEVTFLPIKYC